MMLLMSFFTAQAGNMEIFVTDASVAEVQLTCSGRLLKSAVIGGKATFTETVAGCAVSLVSQVGTVAGNDKYTCDASGCRTNDIEHRNVQSAADRVTIILTDASTQLLELRCPSGYRERAAVTMNTAVFDGVPQGQDCDMFWKNSAPAKGRKIRPGTWYCLNNNGTGVCKTR